MKSPRNWPRNHCEIRRQLTERINCKREWCGSCRGAEGNFPVALVVDLESFVELEARLMKGASGDTKYKRGLQQEILSSARGQILQQEL
jgi:hypothetical protein